MPATDSVDEVVVDAAESELYAAFESEVIPPNNSDKIELHSPAMTELVVSSKVEVELMNLEVALEKINIESIQAISQHFNGELTSVRAIDKQDCLF